MSAVYLDLCDRLINKLKLSTETYLSDIKSKTYLMNAFETIVFSLVRIFLK